jgi:hypothetical protein
VEGRGGTAPGTIATVGRIQRVSRMVVPGHLDRISWVLKNRIDSDTYLAALTLSRTSRNANSRALAVSRSTAASCRLRISVLTAGLLGGIGRAIVLGRFCAEGSRTSFMTPVECQVRELRRVPNPPLGVKFKGVLVIVGDSCFKTDAGVATEAGGVSTLPCLSAEDILPFFRLVMPPLSLRMASTSWTPSGFLGLSGLMYWSRWRPSEEEVKDWWQN